MLHTRILTDGKTQPKNEDFLFKFFDKIVNNKIEGTPILKLAMIKRL